MSAGKLPITLVVIGLVLALGAAGYFIFHDKIEASATDIKADIDHSGDPSFAFDNAKFPDWASAGNVWSDAADGAENDAPIATISVAQCTPNSHCGELVEKCRPNKGKGSACGQLQRDTADGCNIHLSYMKHSINPDMALADEVKQQTSFNDGTAMREVGVKTVQIDTPEGTKQYQLHEYDVTHGTDTTYKRGDALGFVSLTDGHVEVQIVCNAASQLDETLPVLSATRLLAS